RGATGATPLRDLVDPTGQLPWRLVATHVTIPWCNAPSLGQERIGSTLSIAVDVLHSDNVYLAWADRVGTGDIYTVHVRRSTDRGATWSGDVRTLTNATDASLAVSGNGTVGLLYQQVTGSAATSRWVTRLEQSRDGRLDRSVLLQRHRSAMTTDGRSEGPMRTWSVMLLAVALSLSASEGVAQMSRAALVKQSDIIFIGTVTQVGAVAVPEVPAS